MFWCCVHCVIFLRVKIFTYWNLYTERKGIFPNSYGEITITMIPKLDKYYNKEEHFRPVSLISRGDKHNYKNIFSTIFKISLTITNWETPNKQKIAQHMKICEHAKLSREWRQKPYEHFFRSEIMKTININMQDGISTNLTRNVQLVLDMDQMNICVP
jgi:hypothetical protein